MSLQLFTDSSANLSEETLTKRQIGVVSLTVSVGGEEMLCYEPGVAFDGEAFYARMREDKKLETKTSMINTAAFLAAFEPCLKAGGDVLYLAMSSGISGTCSAGQTAAGILQSAYPERSVVVADTLSAVAGQGMQVLEAADLRDSGRGAAEIASYIERRRAQIRQYFIVDDLIFLKRGGRISGSAALAGTIMNLKPILKGNEKGCIVLDRKALGRRKALATLAELFGESDLDAPENRRAGIVHAGCEEDARLLADRIAREHPNVRVTVDCFEPCTGSHVGPGAVGLFFWGGEKRK